MFCESQHGLTHVRQCIHQLAHRARFDEEPLEPELILIGNEDGDVHCFVGEVALEEEGCGLEDGEVGEDDVGHVGFLDHEVEMDALCAGAVEVGHCGDEGGEDGFDGVDDFFGALGVGLDFGCVGVFGAFVAYAVDGTLVNPFF